MKRLILTTMIVLWSAVSFAQKKEEVTVSSSDGAAVKGTFYSAEKSGPRGPSFESVQQQPAGI